MSRATSRNRIRIAIVAGLAVAIVLLLTVLTTIASPAEHAASCSEGPSTCPTNPPAPNPPAPNPPAPNPPAPNPPAPNPPAPNPPAPNPPAPNPPAPNPPAPNTVYWPDGSPAQGVQVAFLPFSNNSDGLDTPVTFQTDGSGNYTAPAWPGSTGTLFPEAWLVVMPTDANQSTLSSSWPTYSQGCFLPLSNQPNPTSWSDIQLQGWGPLYVASSTCEEALTLSGGLTSWVQDSIPGAPATSDIEQLLSAGQLDESEPFSWGNCDGC